MPLLPPSEQKALTDLETSCFQRTFEDDLPEKRLKRLELLTRGMGQSGTVQERIAGLKEFIARQHAAKDRSSPTTRNLGQSVSTLEKFIAKKTSPNLDLNTRLATLEKKVFGTSFPSIPMGQRISRLQKTIGVGDEDLAEVPSLPSRNLRSFSIGPQMMQPNTMFGSPFMSPFGSQNDMAVDPDINQHMSEMFNNLNQQLRQLHRLPPDSQFYKYDTPHPNFNNPLKQAPAPNGYSDGLPEMPQGSGQTKPSLPPYMDPNSI